MKYPHPDTELRQTIDINPNWRIEVWRSVDFSKCSYSLMPLLRALQAGAMVRTGQSVEKYKVEVAFKEEANREFDNYTDANQYVAKVNTVCRLSRVITITQII